MVVVDALMVELVLELEFVLVLSHVLMRVLVLGTRPSRDRPSATGVGAHRRDRDRRLARPLCIESARLPCVP